MKKLIITALIALNGFCANVSTGLDGVPQFENRVQAMSWVSHTIEYKLRSDIAFIQSPEKTLRLKTGVCEDKATLLMKILHDQFGDDPEYVGIRIPGYSVTHAVIRVNGIIYDPTSNQSPLQYEYMVDHVLNYDLIMSWASADNN